MSLHSTLWLVIALLAVADFSEGVADCGIRFEDNGACACSSNDTAGPVTCYSYPSKYIKIQPCHCMFYDSAFNMSIVGHCFYSCYQLGGTKAKITSSAEFNADICRKYGHLNRTGRFCGQCNKGYGLAAYSYSLLKCIPCPNSGYKNWLRYLAVALLPLTAFYILAVLLSFNVNSSSLNGVIMVIQCLSSPRHSSASQGSHELLQKGRNLVLLNIFRSIFGVVNLDFLRYVYPTFCLHPEANIYQIMCLDYLVALYPFHLIFMTYLLVTAYDKRYRLVVWMWRPVQRCVHRHRSTWNIRTSLIEIFATFILFSYVKILSVSFQIFGFTAISDVSGKRLKYYSAYMDGTEYFGPTHLPYALLAIVISSIFVVFPLVLLAVYPCRCFHKCLNCCGLRSRALHIFMDAFQGSYRTEPRDLRYFSVFYLLLRILIIAQFQIFLTPIFIFTSGIVSIISAAVVAIFQPYKMKAHNTIDTVLLILMGISFISNHVLTILHRPSWEVASAVQMMSIAFIVVYFFALLVWKMLGGRLQAVAGKAKALWSSVGLKPRDLSTGNGVESFDRDHDTNERKGYAPLLGGAQPTY